ncbi:MAG TPA: CBS domain-containing protein [Acidimicrobiales bacterium]|nr:CBS domain-containing protein [Acidimicrobiales bacterium]
MLVREIMTPDAVTVGIGEPFKQVAETMLDAGVSGLPVVKADGSLVGIVTEADLVARAALTGRRRLLGVLMDVFAGSEGWWHKSKGLIALELMTSPVRTVGPDEDVQVAARRMMTDRVKRLPVVDGHGRLVGIVSRADLLRVYDRTDHQIDRDVRALLHDPSRDGGTDDIHIRVSDGVVTLRGTVSGTPHRRAVIAAVQGVPGVVAVNSELEEVRSGPSDGERPLELLRHSGVGVDDPNIWPRMEAPPRP